MPFPYKTVLIIGATSGIGAAMAEKLVAESSRVIVCGRRQDRIDQFVKKHGPKKAGGIRVNITDHGSIDAFVKKVLSDYPSLDCVFLNSGVQSATRLSRPLEFDLHKFHHEVNVNFTSTVNLMMKLLPRLQSKPYPTGLIVTGTHLALVPAATMAAYSASKAALTAFVDCCRAQNRHKSTKIIEIYPPVVQTELHDWMGVENGRALGMPVEEFTDIAYEELSRGEDLVVVGSIATESREVYMALVERRRRIFDQLAGALLSRFEL
ncbi:oxidoreductase- short-chain dehydrogenase/reductase family [Apiospora aurea]|uniref:Oxidoreductase- short-chain dehydrogenase/reductase family n=1 Tax=Apiospora aurea TaxID=335848 RepID=A0ABR1QGA0_9PEZI